jgi:ribulose kinase
MEIPKILWLKHNMKPELFSKCQFFDLPDFLTYQATRDNTRSCCSLTCKCSYVPNAGWQKDFFNQIGLQELSDRDYAQVGVKEGEEPLIAGMPVGKGLSEMAAEKLGLLPGTPVGSALIDAYVCPVLLLSKTNPFSVSGMQAGWEQLPRDIGKMECYPPLSHLWKNLATD